MKTLIKNGYVVSMVSDISQTDVLIEDDRIQSIGKIEESVADKVIDATGMVVMPGLINSHTHVAMSMFRGYSDDEYPLQDWLEKRVWPMEEKMQKEEVYHASCLSCLEMIKSGTTLFNDMDFEEEATAEAVQKMGLRAVLSRCVMGEGETASARVQEAENLYQKYHNSANGKIKVCVSFHSSDTCPPDGIKRALELCDRLGTPLHIHYLETKEEAKTILDQYHMTVTDYLQKCGVFHYHTMLAHGVQIQEEDMKTLREISGGIIHNPMSNLKLGAGFADIKKLKDAGITVALGTDGQESCNTLDMFEQMKFAACLPKGIYHDATAMTAEEVLKMATIEGAKVLGMDSELGSIEVGKKADIILVNLNQAHLSPIHHIYSQLVYSVNGGDVDTTIVDGVVLMEHRKVLVGNEEEIIQNSRRMSHRLFQD